MIRVCGCFSYEQMIWRFFLSRTCAVGCLRTSCFLLKSLNYISGKRQVVSTLVDALGKTSKDTRPFSKKKCFDHVWGRMRWQLYIHGISREATFVKVFLQFDVFCFVFLLLRVFSCTCVCVSSLGVFVFDSCATTRRSESCRSSPATRSPASPRRRTTSTLPRCVYLLVVIFTCVRCYTRRLP